MIIWSNFFRRDVFECRHDAIIFLYPVLDGTPDAVLVLCHEDRLWGHENQSAEDQISAHLSHSRPHSGHGTSAQP